jgi:hypothetical protein
MDTAVFFRAKDWPHEVSSRLVDIAVCERHGLTVHEAIVDPCRNLKVGNFRVLGHIPGACSGFVAMSSQSFRERIVNWADPWSTLDDWRSGSDFFTALGLMVYQVC